MPGIHPDELKKQPFLQHGDVGMQPKKRERTLGKGNMNVIRPLPLKYLLHSTGWRSKREAPADFQMRLF